MVSMVARGSVGNNQALQVRAPYTLPSWQSILPKLVFDSSRHERGHPQMIEIIKGFAGHIPAKDLPGAPLDVVPTHYEVAEPRKNFLLARRKAVVVAHTHHDSE